MVVIILAAALGAIFSIVVVLLFRRINVVARHTAEVAETVRQLTETDVELYRELLRLRRSLNNGPTAGHENRTAAVAGGTSADPPASHARQPARRKRHLALYILSTAGLALAALIREACRVYRGRIATALAGATLTASTVTVLTVTPWQGDMDRPPSSAPTAAPTVHSSQPGAPPTTAPPGSSAANPSTSPSGADATADSSSPATSWPTALVPVADTSSPGRVPGLPGTGINPSSTSGVTAPPTAATSDVPSVPSAPSSSAPAGEGVCAGVSASPVGGVDVCLPLLGGG